ncbi:MAG TPA: hypothetical protein VE988_27690 [Gemmataceae bacterium]|jgi:hypothetical protein|nr:hypothetical protein [Gemmataceae bacterium]
MTAALDPQEKFLPNPKVELGELVAWMRAGQQASGATIKARPESNA